MGPHHAPAMLNLTEREMRLFGRKKRLIDYANCAG